MQTPVAWWEQEESALSFKASRGGAWTPLFTEAQLNKARADALREAAEKMLDWYTGIDCINALRRMADEMEKGK